MSIIQISDTKLEKLKFSRFDWNIKKNVEYDPYQDFLDKKSFKSGKDEYHFYKDNISEGEAFHKNYLEYLEICWGQHQIAVASPDIFWYTLMCELVKIVRSETEKYRHLFSESDEKQDIVVTTMADVMPLDLLVEQLEKKVPADSSLFLPDFTTTTERVKHAQYSAFADMCSPYYNYSMLMCGIPAVDVKGEQADWQKLADYWRNLSNLFPGYKSYFQRVQFKLDTIYSNWKADSTWKDIFYLEKCGSGGDKVLKGWIKDLFLEQPSLGYICNYSSGVSKVSYKNLNDGLEYNMFDGLFFSKIVGESLVPDFGSVVEVKI